MNIEANSFKAAPQEGLPVLHTFDQASRALSISPGLLRKLARAKKLKVTHIGRCARISQEEVLRLCNGGAR